MAVMAIGAGVPSDGQSDIHCRNSAIASALRPGTYVVACFRERGPGSYQHVTGMLVLGGCSFVGHRSTAGVGGDHRGYHFQGVNGPLRRSGTRVLHHSQRQLGGVIDLPVRLCPISPAFQIQTSQPGQGDGLRTNQVGSAVRPLNYSCQGRSQGRNRVC